MSYKHERYVSEFYLTGYFEHHLTYNTEISIIWTAMKFLRTRHSISQYDSLSTLGFSSSKFLSCKKNCMHGQINPQMKASFIRFFFIKMPLNLRSETSLGISV